MGTAGGQARVEEQGPDHGHSSWEASCCLPRRALGNLKSAMRLWEKMEDFFP